MTAVAVERVRAQRTASSTPIPMSRVVGVELRKMFDTRSGFWLMASIAIASVIATGAVILFAPEEALTYSSYAAAIGVPMTIILPMVAILSVTSEWSQRSGLTTFTLVPHRGRVIAAKAVATVIVGVVSMLVAVVVGALGNLMGTAITGTELVWDMPLSNTLTIVLGNLVGMFMGFMLGVLIRNSAGAIVAYFVYAMVLPTLLELLAATQEWFRDARGWVDLSFTQNMLFEGNLTGQQWAHLGVAGSLWLVLPLLVGLVLTMRSEVK